MFKNHLYISRSRLAEFGAKSLGPATVGPPFQHETQYPFQHPFAQRLLTIQLVSSALSDPSPSKSNLLDRAVNHPWPMVQGPGVVVVQKNNLTSGIKERQYILSCGSIFGEIFGLWEAGSW